MELNEAVRRIFLRHWWLIGLGIVVGAVIGSVIAVRMEGSTRNYTVSTRIVIDSPDPKVRSESTAIADTVRAIATSPTVVQKALAEAGAGYRDVTRYGDDNISVSALGTSGVVSLVVRDRTPALAAAVANSLADEVISTRLQIANGHAEAEQARLGTNIANLSTRIAKLDSTISRVTQRLAAAGPDEAAVLQTRLAGASQQRDELTQQRGILQSERVSLLSTLDGPSAMVISAATAGQASRVHASTAPSSALGALLGLVAALALVGVLEAVRPTLVGGESVARELGKPHLGELTIDGGPDGAGGAVAAYSLREVARRAGVANIDLLGVGSTVDLAKITDTLDSALAITAPSGSTGTRHAAELGRDLTIRPFGPRSVAEGDGTGLVIIAPAVLTKSALREVNRFVATALWPLLGVMTYKPSSRWRSSSLVAGQGAADADATDLQRRQRIGAGGGRTK